mmetsp:Transcript_19914/g.69142  ORF Transcript_19914/g.69142 Transcript_19914/m.69142 type:complete len:409 (+) Transcript_19914:48-1274(+)
MLFKPVTSSFLLLRSSSLASLAMWNLWLCGVAVFSLTVVTIIFAADPSRNVFGGYMTDKSDNASVPQVMLSNETLDQQHSHFRSGPSEQRFPPSSMNTSSASDLGIDFAIVGFPKTATTELLNNLALHSRIGMLGADLEGAPREDYLFRQMGQWLNPAPYFDRVDAMQKRSVERAGHRLSAIGIKDPDIIKDEDAMRRVASIRDIKLIVVVREPMANFQSYYNYQCKELAQGAGWSKNPAGARVVCPRAYNHSGQWPPTWRDVVNGCKWVGLDRERLLFADIIRRNVFPLVPPSRVLVVSTEGLAAKPRETYQLIFDFLGIPEFFEEEVWRIMVSKPRANEGTHSFVSMCDEGHREEHNKLACFLHQNFHAKSTLELYRALSNGAVQSIETASCGRNYTVDTLQCGLS